MRRYRQLIVLIASLMLMGCEGTTFQSSVPAYPVRLTIDTRIGEFVHFQPDAFGSYVVVNKEGYFLNGNYVLPRGATDAVGYGGVVVYVSMGGYDAYDAACPHCAAEGRCVPCDVDGFYATCPECGEKYDLGSGFALPMKGISHEALRRLNIVNSDGKLTITQR